MKTNMARRLRCPRCLGALQLHAYKSIGAQEVIDGVLSCRCGAAFLVRQGVPCMALTDRLPPDFAESYRDRLRTDAPALATLEAAPAAADFSFSWQWNAHAYDDLTWELRLTDRVKLFYRYLSTTRAEVRGLRMLDAGCGNGTLSAELALEGIDVVGLDFSNGAMRAYRYEIFDSRVTEDAAARLSYVQGDLQHPPFADDQFDLIYCDGVLHHTPDTKSTFMAISKKVKPGGRLFIWLYRSDTRGLQSLKRSLVKGVRRATARMSYSSRWSLCCMAAFAIMSGVRLLRLFGWRGRPVIPLRQKAINLFDTITPTYNHEHTPSETAVWFREAGYSDVKEVTITDFRLGDGGFAMIGTRASNA